MLPKTYYFGCSSECSLLPLPSSTMHPRLQLLRRVLRLVILLMDNKPVDYDVSKYNLETRSNDDARSPKPEVRLSTIRTTGLQLTNQLPS